MASFGGNPVTITSVINNQPLDLAWQDTADFTPIINDNANGGINQKWSIVQQSDGTVRIQSALGPFVSIPNVSTSRQNWNAVVAHSNQNQSISFVIQNSLSNPSAFCFVTADQQALTAWRRNKIATVSPVTLSPFHGTDEQSWTIESA